MNKKHELKEWKGHEILETMFYIAVRIAAVERWYGKEYCEVAK